MSEFSILNSAGIVVRVGHCDEQDLKHQAGPGEKLLVGSAPLDHSHDAATGRFHPPAILAPPPPPPPPTVADRRAAAYPSIADQLDALWHAMDDGVLPRVEPFYGDIAAVKSAYPK